MGVVRGKSRGHPAEQRLREMTTFDLFSSVRDGNTDIVRRLLQSKQCRARLNDRNEWGDTALHLAAEAGNGEICQMLIAAGASVTVRNNRGETCLHRAAVGGHVESVSAIVGRDQDPDAVNSQNDAGYTSLHHAAKHGSRDLIEILVKAGADRMIENNAGETPYMVAHKFQQWEAERLLLNVEQQHADRAIREMNRKEKDIVRAYLRAVKYASQQESRVRIMLVGDSGSGKSSLKKTIFGEAYNPIQKPSSGINADPAITRIKFKQYREWIHQPASKADTHRINLEFIDVIIDYILNFIRRPRIVADDVLDPLALQIEKNHSKNVNFNLAQCVIPDRSIEESALAVVPEGEEEEEETLQQDEEHSNEAQMEEGDDTQSEGGGGMDSDTAQISNENTAPIDKINGAPEIQIDNDDDFAQDSFEGDDDRLHRLAKASAESMEFPSGLDASYTTVDASNQPSQTTDNLQESTATSEFVNTKPVLPSLFDRTIELSRLLVEKMPQEILKRMVIRWPVGDEQYRDRSILTKNRLMLTVWDVSGDPLQQNFTPFFFSDRCMYVTTYDLSKELNDTSTSYEKKNLANIDGLIPTNAQVLEGWIGCATAFQKDMPSEPFQCTHKTPLLPPLIIACTHSDNKVVQDAPIHFHRFFGRKSFTSYMKHLVEPNSPSALRISNHYETISNRCEEEMDEEYCGHHLLRREIDYLARQLPYMGDSIPVQWIKFEQLVYGLQEQKKVILLFDDLARYIAEHCQMSGPLQILPVLSHFHNVGIIVYFYRHPDLCNVVVMKPQWLIDALGSLITSNPGKWITSEVQAAFTKLGEYGLIEKDMLLLAYRCAKMGQRFWNEMLFFLNCMDLLCCHPSVHDFNAVFIPAMVVRKRPDPYIVPSDNDPTRLHFSAQNAIVPVALFNQLVVRCIRSSQYSPVLYYHIAHIRLNSTHHLLLWKQPDAISFLVQAVADGVCPMCQESSSKYAFSPQCSHIAHLIAEEDYLPTDNITTLVNVSTNSGVDSKLHLAIADESTNMVCSKVLKFLSKNLEFLSHCWFPGLKLELTARVGDEITALNQYWKHTVLKVGSAEPGVSIWFE